MSKKEFENLLSNHKSESKDILIDWAKQKQEWLDYIDAFYNSIEKWFLPYKKAGNVTYIYKTIQLTEDHIGTYDVKVMKIDFAGQSLKIEPIGTLLIGTKGRIDMEGSRGRIQFVLADKKSQRANIRVSVGSPLPKEEPKEIDWTWKIVLKNSRRISFEEFNDENFFDALMEVVNA